MLNIEDHDNNEAIDYIRGRYGNEFGREQRNIPYTLPNKLITDKDLKEKLE